MNINEALLRNHFKRNNQGVNEILPTCLGCCDTVRNKELLMKIHTGFGALLEIGHIRKRCTHYLVEPPEGLH